MTRVVRNADENVESSARYGNIKAGSGKQAASMVLPCTLFRTDYVFSKTQLDPGEEKKVLNVILFYVGLKLKKKWSLSVFLLLLA